MALHEIFQRAFLFALAGNLVINSGCTWLRAHPEQLPPKDPDGGVTIQVTDQPDLSDDEGRLTVRSQRPGDTGPGGGDELHGWLYLGDYQDRRQVKLDDDRPLAYPKYAWQHDKLAGMPPSDETTRLLRAVLKSKNKTLTANAAIGLARRHGDVYHQEVLHSLQNTMLPIKLRRAALETLCMTSSPDSVKLQKVVDKYAKPGSDYSAELHAELIRVWAERIEVNKYKEVVEAALRSQSSDVRLAILRVLAKRPLDELPRDVFLALGAQNIPTRIAAIKAVGAGRHDNSIDALTKAANDFDVKVRLAAIEALGQMKAGEASETLKSLFTAASPPVQAAVMKALTEAGELEFVFSQIENSGWQVRAAIADALGQDVRATYQLEAQQLLSDTSGEVRLRAVEALATWEPTILAKILFPVAENDQTVRSRQAAIRVLASKVMPTDEVPAFIASRGSADAIEELRRLWLKSFTNVEQSFSGPAAVVSAESLETSDNTDSGRDAAFRRLNHPFPNERKMGCDYFTRNPDAEATEYLVPLLNDHEVEVVHAALRAIAKNGKNHHVKVLQSYLADDNHLTRVFAGEAMAQLGSREGGDALERLVRDPEIGVRREAVAAMGRLRDPLFLSSVVGLLDDEPSVQHEALRVLPIILGRDIVSEVGQEKASVGERVIIWQNWFRDGGGVQVAR